MEVRAFIPGFRVVALADAIAKAEAFILELRGENSPF